MSWPARYVDEPSWLPVVCRNEVSIAWVTSPDHGARSPNKLHQPRTRRADQSRRSGPRLASGAVSTTILLCVITKGGCQRSHLNGAALHDLR